MDTRVLAYQYAVANHISVPLSWNLNESASRDWFTGFLKRNSSLSIRKPEATSQVRAAGLNRPVVQRLYDNLQSLMIKHHFMSCDVWNCDETNVPTVVSPPDIIATKGLKQVGFYKQQRFALPINLIIIFVIGVSNCFC